MAEVSGPEKFAPPERRPPEKRNDIERIPTLRQHRSEAAPTTGSAVDDLNAVVRRVAGDSYRRDRPGDSERSKTCVT